MVSTASELPSAGRESPILSNGDRTGLEEPPTLSEILHDIFKKPVKTTSSDIWRKMYAQSMIACLEAMEHILEQHETMMAQAAYEFAKRELELKKQTSLEVAQWKQRAEFLESYNKKLEDKLEVAKKEAEEREPLVQVGIDIRKRFWEQTRARLEKGWPDRDLLEAGNAAAHHPNILADCALFSIENKQIEDALKEDSESARAYQEDFPLETIYTSYPHKFTFSDTSEHHVRYINLAAIMELYLPAALLEHISQSEYDDFEVNRKKCAAVFSALSAPWGEGRIELSLEDMKDLSRIIDDMETVGRKLMKAARASRITR
jgi:hypothetical protein